jgi:hypothetical protein
LAAMFAASMIILTGPAAFAQYPTWNGCPPGWTVQGGNCAPYQGPVGGPRYRHYGYHRTYNGCRPGWTVQGGVCRPYRGY